MPKEKLDLFVRNTTAFKSSESEMTFMWNNIKDKIYSLESNELNLGFNPKGTNTYFSKNCTEEDSKLIKEFMENNVIKFELTTY